MKKLPVDYRIGYKEIQRYLFKVGPFDLNGENGLLAGIVDLFEEGAASGKSLFDVTGKDIASFCDELIKDSKTYADIYRDYAKKKVAEKYK